MFTKILTMKITY